MKNNSLSALKLVECPRDAMQGWKTVIPTHLKAEYINALLKVGFDTLDFGSFVSARAIPQMADTKEVLARLDVTQTNTRLLAIVANTRGAEEAVLHPEITYLGYPFSVSETFQFRNANSSRENSLNTLDQVQQLCIHSNKELVVYISMGFGNPYGDAYSYDIVLEWVKRIRDLGVRVMSLADTVGLATPEQVKELFLLVSQAQPKVELGVHLHSKPTEWNKKLDAALQAGCLRFDGALKGIGGCPMANDALVGNMDTELMIPYFEESGYEIKIDQEQFKIASEIAARIFVNH